MVEPAVLELDDVCKRFAGLQAVDHVSFAVGGGTITALIGPNGAGKSTIFNLICGLERPTSGRILVAGSDVTAKAAYQRSRWGLGRSFQTPRIFHSLTVLENVMVAINQPSRFGVVSAGLRLPGMATEEQRLRDAAISKLKFVGLLEAKDQLADSLGFGGQRLLEFARALAANPKLLLLDEPTSGLTPAETEAFACKLLAIVKAGITVLVVEHNLGFLSAIAGKLIVIVHGRKIFEGAISGLRENSQVIEAYVGTPRHRRQDAQSQ